MYTMRVLVLLALLVGSAYSFSWDIILGVRRGIEFYYNETLTHKENIPSYYIQSITYDPVHDRVLFVDSLYPKTSISSFDLSTRKIQTLFTRSWNGYYNARIVYDPVTQLVFWVHGTNISSYSLDPTSFNAVDGKKIFMLDHVCSDIAVDSHEGYIYWITNVNIERARLDGSDRVVLIDSVNKGLSLAIDEQLQKIYWIDKKVVNGAYELSIKSANFYGKDSTTLYIIAREHTYAYSLAVSKDFIYWQHYNSQVGIWQLPKNQSQPVPRKLYTISDSDCWACHRLVVKYTAKEQIQATKSCDGLQHPNNSKSESTVSICQNYCLQGDCNVTAEGQPKCSCKAGYSGDRCEVNACHKYCLNDGICSLDEENQPVCMCPVEYDGERCDVSICKDYCIQGNCSVSIYGKACSCKDGYSGERCEVNVCNKYCSNNGVCSLNEEEEPVCECTAGFEGERCDIAITHTSDCAENTMQQVLQDMRSDVKKVFKDVKRILQFICDRLDEYEAKI